jgi:hypothetical protein
MEKKLMENFIINKENGEFPVDGESCGKCKSSIKIDIDFSI